MFAAQFVCAPINELSFMLSFAGQMLDQSGNNRRDSMAKDVLQKFLGSLIGWKLFFWRSMFVRKPAVVYAKPLLR